MFEKLRKKAGSLWKAGKDKDVRRCEMCTRPLEGQNVSGWLILSRNNGEQAYICTDCAYKTYEAVDGILETYERMALDAANADNEPDGAEGKDPENTAGNAENAENTEVQEEGCTPQSAYASLSSRVVGQEHAKKVIAVAVYNHWKRMKMEAEGRETPIGKSSILLIGPTGTGKTLLAEAAADILDIPFVSINATALTEAGYKGEDVESAVEKLVLAADGDVERAQHGIIYIDEIDKLSNSGREVGAKGVQQSLLKLIEGTMVTLEEPVSPSGAMAGLGLRMAGQYDVDTSGILFICGGSFAGLQEEIKKREGKAAIGFRAAGEEKAAVSKREGECGITNADLEKYGVIPELAGRLPVKAVLDPLGKEELARILTEPENAIMKQYQAMLAADGVEFSCTEGALERIAERALEEKAGARGLRAIIEGVMLETMFRAPGGKGHASLVLTADDIDGATRPEDRLEWDGAEEPAEGGAADRAGQEKEKDKRPEAGKPSGGSRKEVKKDGKLCAAAR